MGLADFTCTGLAYDSVENIFWIADCGFLAENDEVHPRLVAVDGSFQNHLFTISLDGVIENNANLQGIAFDTENKSLWLATGAYIHEVSKTGKKLNTIEITGYANNKINGICYDKEDDSLWVLCTHKYLLHVDKNGAVKGSFAVDYPDQDMVFKYGKKIYITAGADYQGNDNYLCCFDTDKDSLCECRFRLLESYAIEGCYIDSEKLIILNDGLYHHAKHLSSYIAIYKTKDFE